MITAFIINFYCKIVILTLVQTSNESVCVSVLITIVLKTRRQFIIRWFGSPKMAPTKILFYSCQALVKRSVTLGGARGGAAGAEEAPPAPSLRRRPSSPTPPALLAPPRRPVLAANIQGNTFETTI